MIYFLSNLPHKDGDFVYIVIIELKEYLLSFFSVKLDEVIIILLDCLKLSTIESGISDRLPVHLT